MMRFVLLLAVILLVALAPSAQTGVAVPEMASYDAYFLDFLDRHGIPGASVAVAKDGRLVYARGFGLADVEAAEAVQPTSRFRVASVSKPISGVLAMRLVEDGLLDLDASAFSFLDDLPAREGATEDARLGDITVRDLLQHSGGWDRVGTRYDPMFDLVDIANAMGTTPPADVETVVRYMRGRPLDFTPGTTYSYSNLGFAVLGRVLERVAERPYEALVQDLLAEAGVTSVGLGRSLLADRLPGEVRYYPVADTAPSVFGGGPVPWAYGGFAIEAMDAHGGWVASAPDLLRLTTALDGLGNRPDLLSASAQTTMTAKPNVPTWNGSSSWYGLGWSVNANGHWWHTGSLPGSESLLVRSAYEGLHWVVLVNHRQAASAGVTGELDGAMWDLALGVTSWPTHDLFSTVVADEVGPEAGVRLGVYPNPARHRATIDLALETPGHVRVDVIDALGRTVDVMHDANLAAGSHALSLGVRDLQTGVYTVRATTPSGPQSTRLTVVR
ncbi:MAG: serine hydrolase [Bacteroidota bacterium]